jgi:hypothetical protein
MEQFINTFFQYAFFIPLALSFIFIIVIALYQVICILKEGIEKRKKTFR